MPTAKSMLCRYQIINMCLSSKVKRYWSQHALIAKLADNDICVSRRTLMHDIDAMRYDQRLGYNAPIVFCKANKGFYYNQEDYSINKLDRSYC